MAKHSGINAMASAACRSAAELSSFFHARACLAQERLVECIIMACMRRRAISSSIALVNQMVQSARSKDEPDHHR